MFCYKCGKKIDNGSAFCLYCGAKQAAVTNAIPENDEPQSKPLDGSGPNKTEPLVSEQSPKPKGGKKKGLIIAVIALSIVLVSSLTVGGILFFKNKEQLLSTEASEELTDESQEESSADYLINAKIGIAFPTKDLRRWDNDGEYLKQKLEDAGYEVDLQYAANDVATQLSQIENMVNSGCDVLVIAAIEGSSLGEALDMAEAKNIPVIAYDRLIMESDTVDYYATFDNYMVGAIQGQYIVDKLGLDYGSGPFTLEITAGDPGDNNALFFYEGAMDVLVPYIDNGQLVVVSGQTAYSDVCTANWKSENSQSRAEMIISACYSYGTNIDAWLCPNDSTALGVANALEANYTGTYPIITGQDCDIANVQNILTGKQSMSVFKDTRTLAAQVAKMVDQIIKGETVDVNDTETYDNGKKIVPSYLCEPVFVDAGNYEMILIDSGYYTEDDLDISSEPAIDSTDSNKPTSTLPSSMIITVDESDGAIVTGTFIYSYEGDKLTKVALYNGGYILSDEIEIEYDSNGNQTVDYNWGFSSDISLDPYNIYYDENNYVVKTEDWCSYTLYENDANGNPIHTYFYSTYYDENGEFYMQDDSTYDDLNRCVFVHRENFGGEWTNDYTYYYDGNSKDPYYCEIISNDSDGESMWTVSYTYSYDDVGRLIKKVEEHDFGSSSWTITFEYDY